MKILVTGCHGFVGHNVCKALLADGHRVVGTDRLDNAISYKVHRVEKIAEAGLRYVEADLTHYRAIATIIAEQGIEVIFHFAAQFPIKHSRQALNQYLNSNVIGFANVLEAARAHGVRRLVYSSSIAARTGGRPSSMYGATKHFGEEMAHVYSRLGLEVVVMRLAAVYGPMMRTDAGIWKIAQLILGRKPLPMMTGFRSKHAMIFVDDLARCLAALADADLPGQYVLEMLGAHDHLSDFGDVARIIGEIANIAPILPEGFNLSPRGAMSDMTGIERLTGTLPATKLDQGLAKLLEFIG